MPTGLTHPIHDGKDLNSKNFLWRCATQMFYQGEIPTQEELRRQIDECYEATALREAQTELRKLDPITDAELTRREVERRRKSLADQKRVVEERALTLARYNAVRAEVEAWTPPSPNHAGLKKLALTQIDESIKWDCGEGCDYTYEVRPPAQVRKEERARLEEDIERWKVRLAEHVQRVTERLDWLKALEASIGPRPAE